MKRVHHCLLKAFVWLSPLGILIIAFIQLDLLERNHSGVLDLIFGVTYFIWLISAGYTLMAIVVSSKIRQEILSKLAGIRERDERESHLVMTAMKRSFFATFAILLVLSFGSLFRLDKDITESTPSMIKGSLTYGHVDFSPQQISYREVDEAGTKHIYITYGLPFSQSGLLALILAVQILTFRLSLFRSTHFS